MLDPDADREERVMFIARAIPRDVDLSDLDDVTRALFAARYCSADFADILDLIIDRAQINRQDGGPQ